MKRFAIFGSSGCGRGVIPLARQQLHNELDTAWDLVFVDDHPSAPEINGYRVLTFNQWMAEPASERYICIAIANSNIRQKLVDRCTENNVQFFTVKATNTVIMDDVQIGAGAILSPFVTLTSNIKIGQHFHANLYRYVEHDCIIGDFVTFAPGVHCNGNIHIQDHAYIGSGAVIKQGKPGAPLIIGRGAVIGMGAVVTKNVEAGTTVIGNPARVMLSQSK